MLECSIELVACGYAGAYGAARIAKYKRDELKERLPEGIIDAAVRYGSLPETAREVIERSECDPATIIHAKEGGILSALWRLGEEKDCGMEVDIYSIPIRQETIEVCEYFGLNPYRLLSRDCYIIASPNPGGWQNRLQRAGAANAVIGHLTCDAARVFTARGRISYLNRDTSDEIYKVMGQDGSLLHTERTMK